MGGKNKSKNKRGGKTKRGGQANRNANKQATGGAGANKPLLFLGLFGALLVAAFFLVPEFQESIKAAMSPSPAADKEDAEDEGSSFTKGPGEWLVSGDALGLGRRDDRTDFCDIDKTNARSLTEKQFRERYFGKRPVVITGSADDWTNSKTWTKKQILFKFGYRRATASTGLNLAAKNFRDDKEKESYIVYIREESEKNAEGSNEKKMISDYSFFFHNPKYMNELKPPAYLQNDEDASRTLFVGAAEYSGAAFHEGPEAWFGLAYGRTRFFVYPPEKSAPGGIPATYSMVDWMSNVYGELADGQKPMECVLNAGDILYVPDYSSRGWLNIDESVMIQTSKQVSELNPLQLWEKFPENAAFSYRLGKQLERKKRFEQAEEKYKIAVKNDPFFAASSAKLGLIMSKLGRADEAEGVIKEAVKRAPNNLEVLKAYANYLSDVTKKYSKAIKQWQKVKAKAEEQGDDDAADEAEDKLEQLQERLFGGINLDETVY